VHEPTRTLIEIDEHQHYTSARLTTLRLYPAEVPLGFDREEYIVLCRRWKGQAIRRSRTALPVVLGPRGRQRQRAYYDALRDLATRLWDTRHSSASRPHSATVEPPIRSTATACCRSFSSCEAS
jgi:hypothetical protein